MEQLKFSKISWQFYTNYLTLLIGGFIFVEKDNEKLQRSDDSYILGSCNNNTNIIYLREDLYGRSLKKVLCHELTYAAMFSYQINLTLDQEELIADFIVTYGEEIISITNYLFKKLSERL